MPELNVLLIDGNPNTSHMLQLALEHAGHKVTCLASGEEALQWLTNHSADLLLVDWSLSSMDKPDLNLILRFKPDSQIQPTVTLSARSPQTGPIGTFGFQSARSRQNALLHQPLAERLPTGDDNADEQLQIGDLRLDSPQRQLVIGDRRLDLTPVEHRLIRFLMRYPDKVHSRAEILTEVWGNNLYIEERTVDVQIRRLRLRLSQYGRAQLIKTVRGLGYRFNPN